MKPLLILLAAAALLRGALLLQDAMDNPLSGALVVDAAYHHQLAARIVEQGVVLDAPYQRPPLYAYALAGVQAVFGSAPLVTVALQVLLGLAGLALLHRLAREWLSPTGALLAVALAALYGPLAFLELKLLPATLAAFLLLAFLVLLFSPPRRLARAGPHLGTVFLAGVVGGLFILCRPNLMGAPLLLVSWALGARFAGTRWSALVLLAGLAVGVAPATLHNRAAGDGSALVNSGGGFNTWLGNRQGAEVSFTSGLPGVEDAGSLHATSVRMFEDAWHRAPRDARELEAFWYGRALDEIRSDPGAWLALVGRKLRAWMSGFEYGINFSYEAERSLLQMLWLFLVPSWLLLALGLPGLCGPRRDGAPSRLPLLLVVVGVAASSVVFFTYSRFRVMAMPLLAIGAADALLCVTAAVRSRRIGTAAVWLAGIVLVAWLSLLPPDPVSREQLSAGHALVGFAALEAGDLALARQAYVRAAQADPNDPRPRQMLEELSDVR